MRGGWFMLAVALWGCSPGRVFEGGQQLPGQVWVSSNRPVFAFDITDTTATYRISCTVRNTEKYPFYNLYVSLSLIHI